MKKEMSGCDIHAIVKELPLGYVKNIKKISDEEGKFILRIGKKDIFFDLGGWIYVTKKSFELEKMVLKKELENKRIVGIEPNGLDRIINFNFVNFKLVVELFGGGNLFIVRDGIIEYVYKRREFKDRKLKVNEEYRLPPQRHNIFSTSYEEFERMIKSCKFDVVRALAINFNFGGEYAEEICFKAGVDKNKKVRDLEKKDIETVYRVIGGIFEEMEEGNGYVYYSNGEPRMVLPIKGGRWKEVKEFESFSKAIEEYLDEMSKKESEKERIHRRQEEAMEKAEAEMNELNRTIEKVYENYAEIGEKLGKGRMEMDGIEFDPEKSIEQNLQKLYERRKKLKSKVKGIKRAMDKVEIVEKMTKIKREKHKEFWFEKFWWFYTTENFLVIAGKNATDNERIVKRNMGEKDTYLHADIHGGASGMIKTNGKEVDEESLREACHFVVCYSKAWGSISSCDGYWVRPDQVSKKPPSGEFLPKGSFMIYGKKNYFRNLPLRLAVGVVDIPDLKVRKVMCGPESSLSKKSNRWVVVVPGKRKVESAAKEMAELLDWDEYTIRKILPTRGVEIENRK